MEDQPGSRLRLVRRLFDQPEIYLRNDAHIDIRRRATRELASPHLDSSLRARAASGGEGVRLADVGCGDGRCSLQFLSRDVHLSLVDLAPAMLAVAESRIPADLRANVELVESSLENFWPSERFDLVLCLGVLAHVVDVARAVKRLAGLTRPGGSLVVQITDHEEPLSVANDAFHRLKRMVRSAPGYTIQRPRVSDVVSWAADEGLELAGSRQYWVLPPLTGRLPVQVGLDLLTRLYESPRASRFGTEKLMLFTKSSEGRTPRGEVKP